MSPVPPSADPPLSRRDLLVSTGGSALAWIALSESWVLLPLRWLVTFVHEAGHAVAATALGSTVRSMTINPAGGGLTSWTGHMGPLSRSIVASAGYLTAAVLGGALLAGCRHLRSGRLATGGFAAMVALAAVAWVPWRFQPPAADRFATGSGSGDGRFTWLFAVMAIAGFAFLAASSWTWLRQRAVIVIATTLCLAGVSDLRSVLDLSRRGGHSDAATVAATLGLASWFWALLWLLAGIGLCAAGLWWMVRPDADAGS